MFDTADIQVVKPDMYPDSLQVMSKLPHKLYAVGNVDLLYSDCVSVAGSRKIDGYSTVWLRKMIDQCPNHTIVSGLALGADAVAHRAALKWGMPTIAVLPSGVNRITPKQHWKLVNAIIRSGGLLLSEYRPEAYARRDTYVARNEIIAALGKLLIMPQCDNPSGTMHTVNYCKDFGKTIIVKDNDYDGNRCIIDSGDYTAIIK